MVPLRRGFSTSFSLCENGIPAVQNNTIDKNKRKEQIMYRDEYSRWLSHNLEDPDLLPELLKVKDNDDEIKDRFAGCAVLVVLLVMCVCFLADASYNPFLYFRF